MELESLPLSGSAEIEKGEYNSPDVSAGTVAILAAVGKSKKSVKFEIRSFQ